VANEMRRIGHLVGERPVSLCGYAVSPGLHATAHGAGVDARPAELLRLGRHLGHQLQGEWGVYNLNAYFYLLFNSPFSESSLFRQAETICVQQQLMA